MFVTFDSKDLYTNIFFEDAKQVIEDVAELTLLDKNEALLIIDLYKLCNECNYFNVGDVMYKQMKGVSMGCYFSKEISDLVLMYAEYQYLRASREGSLKIFRRYADDGFMFFSSNNTVLILEELRKLCTFYPSNLIINFKLNAVCCQYLDLLLSIDDISSLKGVVHYKTF